MTQLTYDQIAGAVQGLPLPDRQRLLKLLLSQPDLVDGQANGAAPPLSEKLKQHNPNLSWLEEHRAEYAGQWVALHDGQLIAHSNDGESLVEPVRQAGIHSPLIVFVEPPGTELFVGF
jgi:hypothetical protein